jgi:hypothetical protein
LVHGISAISTSAISPWNHHSAWRSAPPAAGVSPETRISSAIAAPTGDHQRVSQTSGRSCFEDVARAADDHQDPQEGPVLTPVLRPVEVRIARVAVRPCVVQLRQFHPAAPDHHEHESRDQHHTGDIQHQREPQIKRAVPEADPEQRLQDVVLQRDRRGAEEQQREAVEDQPVRAAGRLVAPRDRTVIQDRGAHRPETPPQAPLEGEAGAATVLAQLHIDAIAENPDRRIADRVEEPDLGRREGLEQDPGDSVH